MDWLFDLMFVSLFVCLFTQVMEKYSVPDYTDVHEFLAHLGKRLGKLKKGRHKLVIIIISLTREAIQLNYKLSNIHVSTFMLVCSCTLLLFV